MRSGAAVIGLLLLFGGCSSPSKKADAAYKECHAIVESGDRPRAMQKLKSSLATYPDHAGMLIDLATLQIGAASPSQLDAVKREGAAAEARSGGDVAKAKRLLAEARALRSKAAPSYEAARDNLARAISYARNGREVANASFLKMKCEVFFGELEQAMVDLERAIDRGNLPPSQLEECQSFLSELKRDMREKRKLPHGAH